MKEKTPLWRFIHFKTMKPALKVICHGEHKFFFTNRNQIACHSNNINDIKNFISRIEDDYTKIITYITI